MKNRWLIAFAIALVACSSDDGGGGSAKPKPKETFVFEPAATPAGTSVTLRQKELTSERLVLELVGHSVSELYGVAFRLSYDSSVLGFDKLEASSVWSGSPPVTLGVVKTPGVLVATVTEKGKAAGVAGSEVVLGQLSFNFVAGQKPASLEFRANRSAVVGTDGRELAKVGWAGGALVQK
ncbi:MAG: hypothetical protein IPI67_09760 [Myxococcales bacterium]|nr:hypothetical protein [Myxococcales bacterium]